MSSVIRAEGGRITGCRTSNGSSALPIQPPADKIPQRSIKGLSLIKHESSGISRLNFKSLSSVAYVVSWASRMSVNKPCFTSSTDRLLEKMGLVTGIVNPLNDIPPSLRHTSWRMILAVSRTKARNPNGSKTLAVARRSSRLVLLSDGKLIFITKTLL